MSSASIVYLLPILLMLYLAGFSGVATWWERRRRRPSRETHIEGRAILTDSEDPPRH